ncbi:hypothetical protein [Aurantimicrobium minutum]|uniref:hypothetical protein n=1 Tax=Aurantimicrobium minutum TaxID=708131 RepID=UPI0011E4D103|nr:hypothetical protein [Aurantimicrobium minutum]
MDEAEEYIELIDSGETRPLDTRVNWEYSEKWKKVDISKPIRGKEKPQDLYLRLIKLFVEQDTWSSIEEPFRQSPAAAIYGLVNGIDNGLHEAGIDIDREVIVRACSDAIQFVVGEKAESARPGPVNLDEEMQETESIDEINPDLNEQKLNELAQSFSHSSNSSTSSAPKFCTSCGSLGESVSEFETTVESLLDAAKDSNITQVQAQLTAFFKGSESDDDIRSSWAKQAYSLTNKYEDDRRSLLLLSAALEVTWPDYTRGDGYYSEPSDLAVAATVIGVNNSDESFFTFSKDLSSCAAINFYDLGVVSNPSVSSENVMYAVKRSNLDPVRSIAAVSNALERDQIMDVLGQIDSSGWLVATLLKSDGWFWPEWQYAFEQASYNCEPSAEFWKILLQEIRKNQEDLTSEFLWIPEFIEEFEANEGLDPEFSEETFELLSNNQSLRKLAMESKWEPLIEALENL